MPIDEDDGYVRDAPLDIRLACARVTPRALHT
jgi:hypothetical protein